MKDRLIFKDQNGDIISLPKDKLAKVLGSQCIYYIDSETFWDIHKDHISFVDEQLFPEEYLI